MIVTLSGCGDFFDEKTTELESRNVLRELSQIDPSPSAKLTTPDIYKKKPRIVETKIGDKTDARLYYFTKYHTADKLASLINTQFIKKFFDAKGKPYPVLDYSVSPNVATNQLIIRCPSKLDAEQVLEFLEYADVPPVQVRIDCLISEVYADHTMDWETTLQIENLLGSGLSLGGKDSNGTLLPAFPGAALRDVARASFGLKTGYVQNAGVSGHEFRALVDILVSRGYLKILMNPTLEVLNGETAKIETSEHVPLDQISNVHPITGIITQSTKYHDVIDSLEITPYVFADGYIGLKTEAVIGSKATPEGVKQVPIVTERRIKNTENRIRQGESLVIGGITKTEKRSVVRGVPFLKDIPLIGVLFSSKDFEERGKEVLFVLTPTISTYGISNEEMVKEMREKHDMPTAGKSLTERITNPFGNRSYTDLVEEEATEAEMDRAKTRIEMTYAKRQIEMLTVELEKVTGKLKKEHIDKEKGLAEIQSIRRQIEKAQADVVAVEKRSIEIEKQSQAAKAEADKAKADADKAKAEAAAAQQRTAEIEKQSQAIKAEADKVKAEAEAAKARLDAERARESLDETENAIQNMPPQ